jgi:hypothetical protein
MVNRFWPPPPLLVSQIRDLSQIDPLEKLLSQAASVIFLGIIAFGILLNFSSTTHAESSHLGRFFIWFLMGGGLASFLVYSYGRSLGRKRRTQVFEQSFRPVLNYLAGKGRSSFSRSCENVIRLIPRFQSQNPQNSHQLVPLAEAFDFLLLLMVQSISLAESLKAPPSVDVLEESVLEIQRLFIYYDSEILQRSQGKRVVRELLSSQIAAVEFQANALEQALLLERMLVTGAHEIDRFLRDTVGQNERTIANKAAQFAFQWSNLKQKIIRDFGGFLASSGHSS